VYPLDSYKIGQKEERVEKDANIAARFSRMEEKYESEGLRRSVEGVLLVHQHKHPHVLLLQQTLGNQKIYKLPGGRIKPGEIEKDGLLRKLVSNLAPTNKGAAEMKWEIGDELSTWWRPNFGEQQYPYLPVHVTRPKECKKLFLVHLPETSTFAIAKNRNLVAVPLYELYDNLLRYGPIIAAIPLLLSRHASICSTPEKLEKPTPSSTPAKKQKTEEPKTDKKPEPKTAGKKNEIKARTDTDSKADKKMEQRTDEVKTEQKLDLKMQQVESEHKVDDVARKAVTPQKLDVTVAGDAVEKSVSKSGGSVLKVTTETSASKIAESSAKETMETSVKLEKI